MAIFCHSEFIPVFLGKIVGIKFEMAIFGHSEFIPVFLAKNGGNNLEQPFLVIPNLYQSFLEKLLEKIQNSHFWPFKIYTCLLGKIVQKNSEGHFRSFQIYTSLLRKNSWNKI